MAQGPADEVVLISKYLEGRYVPTAWLLGRLFIRYLENKEEVDALLRRIPGLWRALGDLKRVDPGLYAELHQVALIDAVAGMPSQLDSEQVSFLLGRLLRAAARTQKGDGALIVTGRLAAAAAAVLLTDAPALWVRGFERGAKRHLKDNRNLSLPARRLMQQIAEASTSIYPALSEFARGST